MLTDYLRVRALPLNDEITRFVAEHERCYVIEQNRDAQFMELLKLLPGGISVPGCVEQKKVFGYRVQLIIFPSKLGVTMGLLNDATMYIQSTNPEKEKKIHRG